MFSLWKLLCFILIHLFKIRCMEEIEQDTKRPFWNIAHMVNAISQIDEYLGDGANSLEFDVSFDSEGRTEYTYHGIPCDFLRDCMKYENFTTFLQYLQNITSPSSLKYRPALVLLFIDCKLNKLKPEALLRAGEDLATKLLDYYWQRGESEANASILISVPKVKHVDFVNNFRKTLERENFTNYESKIGYVFSQNEDLELIHQTYKDANISKHIWQGDGISNVLPHETTRLNNALLLRDNTSTPGFMDKVYYWTVDKESTMREILRMEVDGMITNYPGRLNNVLSEEEFSSKFRIATLNDSPWEKHRSTNGNS